MQWPIVLVAREDFNQRTSAELDRDPDDPYRREIAREIYWNMSDSRRKYQNIKIRVLIMQTYHTEIRVN